MFPWLVSYLLLLDCSWCWWPESLDLFSRSLQHILTCQNLHDGCVKSQWSSTNRDSISGVGDTRMQNRQSTH